MLLKTIQYQTFLRKQSTVNVVFRMFWRLITGNEEAEAVQGRDKWGGRFSFVFPPQVKCYTSLSLKKNFLGFFFRNKVEAFDFGSNMVYIGRCSIQMLYISFFEKHFWVFFSFWTKLRLLTLGPIWVYIGRCCSIQRSSILALEISGQVQKFEQEKI